MNGFIDPLKHIIRQYRDFFSVLKQYDRQKLVLWIFVAALVYYIFVFSAYSILLQATYFTQAFDSGIDDQGIWLLSRFLLPFVTVRGMNLFADSITLYHFIAAPFFWLWNNINVLYILQTILIALAAVPIFFYARDKLKSAGLALCIAFSFLLFPAVQNLNLDMYHSEAYAVFFIASTLYCMFKGNYRYFYLFLVLSLVGKEDIALTTTFMGLYLILFKREYKHGGITLALSVSWYLICSRLLLPYFNAVGIFAHQPLTYSHWHRGLICNLFNPIFYLANIFHVESLRYYFDLLAPVAFIPLLSPSSLFLLVPSLAVNVLSGCGYLRSIYYHYNYVTSAILFFGLIEGVYILRQRLKGLAWWLGGVIIVAAVIGNCCLSHLPLYRQWSILHDRLVLLSTRDFKARNAALACIPPEAKVSASYSLVPHLSHRREIYMFPNPFISQIWNQWFQEGRGLPPVEGHVDYIAVDLENVDDRGKMILQGLEDDRQAEVVFFAGGVLVLKMQNPPLGPKTKSSVPTGKNLVKNGSFEENFGKIPREWRIEGWQDKGAECIYVTTKETHKDGRYAAKIEHRGKADSRWVQEVWVRPGSTYKLTGWIKTVNVSREGTGAYIGIMYSPLRTKVFWGTNDWQKVEMVFSTEFDQKSVILACRLGDYGLTTRGTAYFDAIIIQEVPATR